MLSAVTVMFAIPFMAALLSYFGYLRLGNGALYTPVQIVELALITLIPALVGAA